MNNGTRKADGRRVMKTLYSSPGLEDLWQIHFSVLSGQELHGARPVHRELAGTISRA